MSTAVNKYCGKCKKYMLDTEQAYYIKDVPAWYYICHGCWYQIMTAQHTKGKRIMCKKRIKIPAKQLEFEFMSDPKFVNIRHFKCTVDMDISSWVDSVDALLSKIDPSHDPSQLSLSFAKDKPFSINGHEVVQVCMVGRGNLL
jgi:hypothetical protein